MLFESDPHKARAAARAPAREPGPRQGGRLRARLTAKAASVIPGVDQLRYIVCARSEVVVPGDSDTIAITARDIFPDPV